MTAPEQTSPEAGQTVVTLAAQRRLGGLLDSRGTKNPMVAAFWMVGTSVVAFLLAIGLTATGWDTRGIGWIGLILLVVGVIAAIWAVRSLLRGHQQWFLYEGGLVATKNGKPRGVAWTEVTEVEEQVFGQGQLFAGKTGAYLVKPARGRPIRVQSTGAVLPEGQFDPFGERLKQLAAAAGRPIVQRTLGRSNR